MAGAIALRSSPRVPDSANENDPVFLFSQEKGFLLLYQNPATRHTVTIVNVTVPSTDACFGSRWSALLLETLVGYHTLLLNTLQQVRGRGYLQSLRTGDMHAIGEASAAGSGSRASLPDVLMFKLGVVLTSLFVFFTTSMSVAFMLKETQTRMLKFTVGLQHHARRGLPTFRLIVVHVMEILVFVPITIGILFVLFEFFEDQLLAFLVLSLVWLCESFTMISGVHAHSALHYFPVFFFLYLTAFLVYHFSFSYGYSYLAFFTMASFVQHSVMYFWRLAVAEPPQNPPAALLMPRLQIGSPFGRI